MTTAARRDAAAADIARIMQLPMAERRGPLFTALFVRAAGPVMRQDLAPVFDRMRPDVILREAAELAAAPMAAARQIPLVTAAFSGVLPEPARREVLEELRSLWEAEGLEHPSWPDLCGQLYLHPWRAAITFPWREVLAAAGGRDIDAVATIGPHVDSATLGTVPSNVRVERFVPQAALLERATAVISHGGAGTVLGADSHSRPRLIVPLFADQWENGIAVRDAGLRRAGRS